VERVRRHLSLVAKTQYCAVVVSRGGWYQVTVSLLPPLQPARSAGDWARMSFDLFNGTCVNSCRIQFYLYDTPSIGSDLSDNHPFSNMNG